MRKSYFSTVNYKCLFILFVALSSFLTVSAAGRNEQWEPIAKWPFLYKEFEQARIITSAGKAVHGKSNIHVGMHYLWFINGKGKKLAATNGTISRVEFNNGDVYLPIENKLCKVVRQDSIHGKLCHVYRLDEVDMVSFNEKARNHHLSSEALDLGFLTNTRIGEIADNEGASDFESEPLPMKTIFYMDYDGDTFQATEGNILKHLEKSERNSYRSFTRSAEIIYSNESSILEVWATFFVR